MDACSQGFLHFSRPMESVESTRQWRARLPEFECCGRGKTEQAHDRDAPRVCQTPASRWRPTERQYTARRPLFTSEHCASSSKKTQPLTHTEKVRHTDVTGPKDDQHLTDTSTLSLTLDRLSFRDTEPPLLSTLDLSSPPAVPDLCLHLKNQPLESPLSSQRHYSSLLEVQRLNPPLRPPLSSTVLYPTYTPRSGLSTVGQAHSRLGRSSGAWREVSLCSSSVSKGHSKSPHQENYWNCAIPKGLPPSPDRRSADWDPRAEYEALLDYTYPLQAGRGDAAEPGRSTRQKYSLAGPDLQDSGIGLDNTCSSSTSLSPLCLAASDGGQPGNWRTLSPGQRSPDLRAFSESPDCVLSDVDRAAWSPGSEDAGKQDYGHSVRHRTQTPTSPSHSTVPVFSPSSSFFPTSRRIGAEVDEEFWPLPEQLEELQLLSRQVREVAAQLSQPVTSGLGPLSPKATFVSSSFTLPRRERAETEVEEGCDTGYQKEYESNVAPFSGRIQPGSQKNQGESDSLLQHIQIFCSHLEELIRQLYAEAERTKPSLDESQTLNKDLSSHQPTAGSVLSTGQLLLRCINTMSPFLRDTLLLVEKRSGVLAAHQCLVDGLLQSTPVLHNREEDLVLGGVSRCTL